MTYEYEHGLRVNHALDNQRVHAAYAEGWQAVIVEYLVYATRRGYVGNMCSGCEPGVDVLAA